MKNKLQVMIFCLSAYSFIQVFAQEEIVIPKSLRSTGIEYFSDLLGITTPCDRVSQKFFQAIRKHSILESDERFFYSICMQSSSKYREGSQLTPTFNPLMKAAWDAKVSNEQAQEIVRMFKSGGININTRDEGQETALHKACRASNFPMMNALIAEGADAKIASNMNLK